MKKLITLIVIFILMFSCEGATLDNSVPNPEQFTTVEMQKLQKDTVVIAMDGTDVYIFENDVVKTQLKVINDVSIVVTIADFLFIGFVIVFLVGVIFIILNM